MLNAFGNEHLKLLVHKILQSASPGMQKIANCKTKSALSSHERVLPLCPCNLLQKKNQLWNCFTFAVFPLFFQDFHIRSHRQRCSFALRGSRWLFQTGKRFESSSSFPPGGDQRDQQNLGAFGLPQKLQAWYKFLIAMLVICVRYPQCDTVTECQERSGWSGWSGWLGWWERSGSRIARWSEI